MLRRATVPISRFSRSRQVAKSTPTRHYCASPSTDGVRFEKSSSGVVVTLDRPKQLNALNLPMIRALIPKYKEWEADTNVSCIVLKGAGEKAFCAGGDIVAVRKSTLEGTSLGLEFFAEEYRLNYLIGTLTTPQVAIMKGFTMGGGVGLSVHGKYRVATESTVFAMPETAIGFFCDVGGSHFLSRLSCGLYLALTGARLTGPQAVDVGVCTHFVPESKLADLEAQLGQVKTQEMVGDVLDKFHAPEPVSNAQVPKEDIEKHFGSVSSVEEIYQSLESTDSDFAKGALKLLRRMSPTSLKVVLEQLKRGKDLSLKDALKMEHRMAQTFLAENDFCEGVRALLVDKDRKPQWKPPQVAQVTDDIVASYFKPLPMAKELTLEEHAKSKL